MFDLPSLDAHAHIDARAERSLGACGAVLAQTASLAEAERSIARHEPFVTWGVGCHPRDAVGQARFSAERYGALIGRSPVAGEVGLDGGSRVPWPEQLATFRAVLRLLGDRPRIVSVHSSRAVQPVLSELRRAGIIAPILHAWTGNAAETTEAVELGCSFSVHAAVARRSIWRTRVPLDRILVESDHGWRDPPDAIPLRVGWVEHLLAQQYAILPADLREHAWRNLARLVEATGSRSLFPDGIARVFGNLAENKRATGSV